MFVRICFTCLLFVLAGCQGTSVVLSEQFPQPLVNPIPLSIGVYYSDEFKAFRHEKKEKGKGTFSVDIGEAHVNLFDTLLAGVFGDVKKIGTFPQVGTDRHAGPIISPEIAKLELSIPEYTQDKIYEVWINYTMRLFNPDGTLALEWPLVAYGKTPVKFLKFKRTALTQATHVALRDAGVQFILSLEQPQLQQWFNAQLSNHNASSQLPVGQK